MSTVKNQKMKTWLVNRIKKWMFFALIGCLAYFVGYSWGHRNQTSRLPASPPVIQAPK